MLLVVTCFTTRRPLNSLAALNQRLVTGVAEWNVLANCTTFLSDNLNRVSFSNVFGTVPYESRVKSVAMPADQNSCCLSGSLICMRSRNGKLHISLSQHVPLYDYVFPLTTK